MGESDASIFCSFCNEEFTSTKAIGEHLLMCGNKTDECPKCEQFIRRAIFAYHYENNCANPDKLTVTDEINHDKQNSDRVRVSIKCEYCNENYDRVDRKVHKENCRLDPINVERKQRSFIDEDTNHNPDRSRQLNDDAAETFIPCEYCFKEIPWHLYENHIKACQEEEHQRLQRKCRRTSPETIPSTKTETAPCRFCKKLMSITGILYHQLICIKNARRNKNA